MQLLKPALVASGALAFASCSALAASTSYNPDRLPADQIALIADVCVNTMGLNPQESPVGGVYRGSPHLDDGVNHYQACVAALSDSERAIAAANRAQQADGVCRAKGLPVGTAELANCVLQGLDSETPANVTSAAPLKTAADVTGVREKPSNFFLDSPRVTRHKEESACARLGLLPPGGAFAKCVQLLHDNFFSIDNPID